MFCLQPRHKTLCKDLYELVNILVMSLAFYSKTIYDDIRMVQVYFIYFVFILIAVHI